MHSFLLCFFICICAVNGAFSQRVCATTDYTNYLLKNDPGFKAGSLKANQQIAATLNHKNNSIANRDTVKNEIIYIPLVVHILYKTALENISDAQVKSQLDALNKDFRRLNADQVNTPGVFAAVAGDARIQFCLAQVDPLGRKTNGIDRKYTDRDFFTTDDAMKNTASGGVDGWNNTQYLNIWVVRLSGRSLAYATPPGAAADRDGVVVCYDVFGTVEKVRSVFNLGRTVTHEVGHWLGLIHIWGDESCGNDFVDDTPTQQSYNFGCNTFPKRSACSPDNNGDMFMNFMDFSDDACMNLFTLGQVKRMRALFAKGNIRNSFLASVACDSTMAQGGPLPDTTKPTTPTTVSLSGSKVYPNPVSTVMTVDCKAATSITFKTMRIVNSTGVTVYVSQLKQQITTHNLSKLSAGVYFVQIADGKDKFITKVFKL